MTELLLPSPAQSSDLASARRPPLLTSLGLAVIDEIRFGSGEVIKDILGGSGTYCTVGARLFTPEHPTSISWMVHAGDNFPAKIEQLLATWRIDLRLRKLSGQASTRGLLIYADTSFGPKTFEYTTPLLSVAPTDLKSTDLLASRAFHLLCDPHKLQQQVCDLINLRSSSLSLSRPLIVWEPMPPACVVDNLSSCFEAIKLVDVFSPNHLELLSLFGIKCESFSRSVIENVSRQCLKSGIGPGCKGVAVVRAGEQGCLLMADNKEPVWMPPYYASKEPAITQSKVVDATGAGNAFLGGLAIGYLETDDWFDACCFGSVAASFMLEQVGVPKVERRREIECWNGENPRVRLEAFRRSLARN